MSEKARCITCHFVYGSLHVVLDMAGDVTHEIRHVDQNAVPYQIQFIVCYFFLEHRKMLNYRKNALIRDI